MPANSYFFNVSLIDLLFIGFFSNNLVTLATTFAMMLIVKPLFKRMPSSTRGEFSTSYSFVFTSYLFPGSSLLVTFYLLLVTFYSLLVTTYLLLFTFHSSLLILYSLLFTCYFCSLISTIYFLNSVMLRTLI